MAMGIDFARQQERNSMPSYQLNVNGKDVSADVDDPTMPLLYA